MRILRHIWLVLMLCLAGGGLEGQPLPELMSPPRLVNDFAGLLTPAQQAELENELVAFDRETSTQIAVVTVTDLGGYAPGDFAQRLYDKWGVGRAGKNNGILVLVKPKTPDSNGEAFISVGYGLEGVVPDITAGRIIDAEMLPSFRQGDMYAGIDKAVGVLMQLTRGEFTAEEYIAAKKGDDAGFALFFLIGIFVLLTLLRSSRKGGGGNGTAGGRGQGWFPPIFWGGGGHGGFGGGSGGFGGFGGGMSGGGGGGRSW